MNFVSKIIFYFIYVFFTFISSIIKMYSAEFICMKTYYF